MGRVRGWLGDRRDTVVVLLIAVAFLWLGKQQLENHSTAGLAHKTAAEAKGTAEEAKELAIVAHRDAERLDDLAGEAAAAYCKLKLYDELSGTTSSHLFARLGVLPPQVAKGVRDALRLVESIRSPRVCDTATSVPTSKGKHGAVTSTLIERQIARIAPTIGRAPERPPAAHISPPGRKPAPAPVLRPQRPPGSPKPAPVPTPAPTPPSVPPTPSVPQLPGPHVEVEVPGLVKACANAGPAEHNPHCQGVGVSVGQ